LALIENRGSGRKKHFGQGNTKDTEGFVASLELNISLRNVGTHTRRIFTERNIYVSTGSGGNIPG